MELDPSVFSDEIKSVSLGKLKPELVDFIVDKKPAFEGRISDETDILFWSARVKHTEQHRKDFANDEEFERCFRDIPNIIQNPDYISIHPSDESVSFIKDYTGHVSVAIKVSTDGKLVYRTMYPLSESQLTSYINSGRAWKIT